MEGGLINPLALIRTGAAEGVTSAAMAPFLMPASGSTALTPAAPGAISPQSAKAWHAYLMPAPSCAMCPMQPLSRTWSVD